MMTLNKKEKTINNDVNWNNINKTSLATIILVMVAFLTTLLLTVVM